MDYAKVLERVSSNKQEIILARQVERDVVDKIEAMKLGNGVGTAIDTKRYYSAGSLFSQLWALPPLMAKARRGLSRNTTSTLPARTAAW
ncbi:MAG: hypothetical protein V8Q85_06970 [Christensenellales bacterium]